MLADCREEADQPLLPAVPTRAVVSAGAVNPSWFGAAGRGPVGDELQALTTREAIATATKVR
jgi:hypothetical protein